MQAQAFWHEMDHYVRRYKTAAQYVGMSALILVIIANYQLGWRAQFHPLACVAAMTIMVFLIRPDSIALARLLALSIIEVETLGFRFEAAAMGDAGLPWVVPLAICLSLGATLFFIRPIDYSIALACIWLTLLLGDAYVTQTYGLIFLCLLIVVVVGIGFLTNVAFTTTTSKLILTRDAYRQQSEVDELTGLPNRRMFLSCLQDNTRQENRYLVMLDVDHFKNVNDMHGHQVGDLVLQTVAGYLMALGESVACGRLGGEEFGLLVEASADKTGALMRLLDRLTGQPIGGNIPVSFSAGVVRIERNESASQAMRRADIQLYLAKRAGRSCAFFEGRKITEHDTHHRALE